MIFKWSIAIGAMLAVLMLVYGGFQYMTSDVVGDKKKALDRIRGAIVGLLLLLSVFIILNVINPCLLQINVLSLHPGGCSPQSAQPVDQNIANSAPEQETGAQQTDTQGRAVIAYTSGMCVGNTAPANCIQPIPVCSKSGQYWAKGADGCLPGETSQTLCQGGCTTAAGQAIDLSTMTTVPAGTTCEDGTTAKTACVTASGTATAPQGSAACPSNTLTYHVCPAPAVLGSLPAANTITSSSGGVDHYGNGMAVGNPGTLSSCSNVQHACVNANRTYTARTGTTCTTGTPKDVCPAP
jgi:hypothetical protein